MPFEWLIGWRYTRAGRAGRRNSFISFISLVSMLGIGLGVSALIIVLSVMNGFQKEVRDRMLAAIPHVQLMDENGNAMRRLAGAGEEGAEPGACHPGRGAVHRDAVAAGPWRRHARRGGARRRCRQRRRRSPTLAADLQRNGVLQKLVPGSWNIVLGAELARSLGVSVGDQVTVIAPGAQVTPAGALPRLKSFNVVGVFSVGHYEYDSGAGAGRAGRHRQAVPHRRRRPACSCAWPTCTRRARRRDRLAAGLGDDVRVQDWTRTNAAWYDAVQIEKTMMFIILTLIVAVAAFNLVSTLVMTVTDKQADIAILRTLGAQPALDHADLHGAGRAVGHRRHRSAASLLGLLIAFNIPSIVPVIEHVLQTSSCRASVYLIGHMPSDLQASDIGADRLLGAAVRVPRHPLSELARQPRPSRGGPAL